MNKLEKKVTFLATIASAAPFIGLFGTVWGILDAFQKISTTGATNLSVIGPGISEALVATAAGLFAAIPAVFFYNHFTSTDARRWRRRWTTSPSSSSTSPSGTSRRCRRSSPASSRAAASDAGRRVSTTLAEINVIPLVDVMLVLLIIFMVAAPMLQRGVEVTLPRRSGRRRLPASGCSSTCRPRSARTAASICGKEPIRLEVLAERIRQRLVNRSDKQVFVRSDNRLDVQASSTCSTR